MNVYRWIGVVVAGAAWVFAWLVIVMALAGDEGAPFGLALVACAVFYVSTLATMWHLVAWAMGRRYQR